MDGVGMCRDRCLSHDRADSSVCLRRCNLTFLPRRSPPIPTTQQPQQHHSTDNHQLYIPSSCQHHTRMRSVSKTFGHHTPVSFCLVFSFAPRHSQPSPNTSKHSSLYSIYDSLLVVPFPEQTQRSESRLRGGGCNDPTFAANPLVYSLVYSPLFSLLSVQSPNIFP